jgi:hypothetical protein
MDLKYKYLKYKKKYLELKKYIGGNLFYFSVYVFTREPLDIERKNIIMRLLGEIFYEFVNTVINFGFIFYNFFI